MNKKEALEKGKIKCGSCTRCCEFSSGFLAENDDEKIAKYLGISVDELREKYLESADMFGTTAWRPKFPKPFGKCIFLTKEGCKVHPVKPLLCRVGSCKSDQTEWFYKEYFRKEKDTLKMWNIREQVKEEENEQNNRN